MYDAVAQSWSLFITYHPSVVILGKICLLGCSKNHEYANFAIFELPKLDPWGTPKEGCFTQYDHRIMISNK